jgi:hypothetical protein
VVKARISKQLLMLMDKRPVCRMTQGKWIKAANVVASSGDLCILNSGLQ